MRNPFLNGLRGFDISCEAESADEAKSLCASISSILAETFDKPVEVKPSGSLPPPKSLIPMPNRVWIVFSASLVDDKRVLGAKWGSAMNMAGVPAETLAQPVEIERDATSETQARAILHQTPFIDR